MNEQQRQQYLDAMDIQPWFPRYILPEARPSTPCEWDWEWERVNREPENQNATAKPLPVVEQPSSLAPLIPSGKQVTRPSDLLADTMPGRPEASSVPQEDIPAAKVTPGKPAERFRLVTLSVNDDCLIVSELPSAGMNQFTRFHERLLRNLLFAVGVPVAPTLQPALFDWPIAGNRADQDEQAAHDAVHGYLTNQFGLRRRKTLFLLGRNCVRYTLGPETDFDEIRGIQTNDQQVTVITHSLDALMKLPTLKTEAWRDISPILTHTR